MHSAFSSGSRGLLVFLIPCPPNNNFHGVPTRAENRTRFCLIVRQRTRKASVQQPYELLFTLLSFAALTELQCTLLLYVGYFCATLHPLSFDAPNCDMPLLSYAAHYV
jgi:hypothetical protein